MTANNRENTPAGSVHGRRGNIADFAVNAVAFQEPRRRLRFLMVRGRGREISWPTDRPANVPSGLPDLARDPRVDAGPVGRQAPAGGPVPQPLDRLAGRDGHRHDVRRGLDQRDVEQRRQAAAGPDLRAGQVAVAAAAAGRDRARTSPGTAARSAPSPATPGRSRKKIASNRSARVNSGGSFETSLAEQTK